MRKRGRTKMTTTKRREENDEENDEEEWDRFGWGNEGE